jgi:hypothetical protein
MITRARKVRGRPFKPGNPGRPPGSKNKVTQTLEQLAEGQAEQLFQKVLEGALAGDVSCQRLLLPAFQPRRTRCLPAACGCTVAVLAGDDPKAVVFHLVRAPLPGQAMTCLRQPRNLRGGEAPGGGGLGRLTARAGHRHCVRSQAPSAQMGARFGRNMPTLLWVSAGE